MATSTRTTKPGLAGLIALGISGGIIPCTDAIALLAMAISSHKIQLAVPLLLAFSTGLAAVLVLIGVAVVRFKHLAGGYWSETRFFRALPVVSAAWVFGLGLWLCYASARG
jgi:nickel/cobalt exporter